MKMRAKIPAAPTARDGAALIPLEAQVPIDKRRVDMIMTTLYEIYSRFAGQLRVSTMKIKINRAAMKKGFTRAELLIRISVSALITAATVAGYTEEQYI